MGWLYPYEARSKYWLINYLTDHVTGFGRPNSNGTYYPVIKSCYKGTRYKGVLWAIVEIRTKDHALFHTGIVAFSIQYNKYDKTFGYKEVSEDGGIYQLNCPLSYLTLCPYTPEHDAKGWAKQWRDKVIQYHKEEKSRGIKALGIKVGCRVKLKNTSLPYVDIVSIRPLKGSYGSTNYKIPKRCIDSVIEKEINNV